MRQVTHNVLTPPANHPAGLPWPLRLGDHVLGPSAKTHFVAYWSAHTWIIDGTLEVEVEGRRQPLSAGDAFFCRIGESWQLLCAGKKPVQFRSVDWVGNLPSKTTDRRFFTVSSGVALATAFDRLRGHLLPARQAQTLAVQADAFACLAALVEPAEGDDRTTPSARDLLASAYQQARLHLAEGIGLAELAKICGVSVSTLRRHFLEAKGTTAGRMLADLKMERARALLRTTDFTHDFIARECGFRTEPAFSRSFSRAHGKTPSQWRREQ